MSMIFSTRSLRSTVATFISFAAAIIFSAQPALAAAWVSMPSGTTYDLYGLAMSTDGTRGIAAGGNFFGSALKWSSDGGKTWNSSSAGGATIMRAVSFAPNSQTAWVVGGSGKILRTTDGGSSFTDQTSYASTASGGATFYGVFALNTYTVYAVGSGGKVIKSYDEGLTWTSKISGTSNILRDVYFTDEDYGWIVGDGGVVIKTTNEGLTWGPQQSNSGTLRAVYFLNRDTGYAVGDNRTLIKTTNSGLTWTTLNVSSVPPVTVFRSVNFFNSSYGLIGGDNGTVVETIDGSSWNVLSAGTTNSIYKVLYNGSSNAKYAAGLSGTILKYDAGNPTTPTGLALSTGGTITNNPSPTFVWNASTDAETSVVDYEYALTVDNNILISGGNINSTTPSYTVSVGSANQFKVYAKDSAGNTSGWAILNFIYDATPPTVGTPSPATATVGQSVTISASYSDTQTAVVLCGLYVDDVAQQGSMNLAGGTANVSYAFPSAGSHTVKVTCRDEAGNIGTSAITAVNVAAAPATDTTPPTVGAPSPATATVGQSVTISASYSDTQTAVVLCGLYVDDVAQQGSMNLAGGTANVSYAFPSAGLHNVKVTCRDEASNIGTSVVTVVNVTTTPIPTDTTPSVLTSNVSASPSSVTADNASIATISVLVKNAASTALSGKSVSLSTSRSTYDTTTTVTPVTSGSGYAVFTVRSNAAGSSSLTATVDGITIGSTVVTFTTQTITPPPIPSDTVVSASQSLVISAPKKVKANGWQKGKVIVVAKNASGQVLSGKTVTIASSFGSVSLNQTQATTNAYGVATFDAWSAVPGAATFTATVNGTVLDKKPTITFILPSYMVCVSAPVSYGTLVKLPDDSNPYTQEDTAVYFYGQDCKRHAFPNSKIYFTWYQNFNNLVTVSPEALASMQLGSNVLYRPAIRMVKFTTVNKVYAVGMNGELRWVTSEAAAISLYGSIWNKSIDDISDAFYTNYTFGADINDANEFQASAEADNATTINDNL
ncbi:MAG: YCF48-related protein [Patescibacteria group bacterium]